MTDLEKTITLKKGIGLAICMLIGTGILALPGLALSVGNVHEAILGWLLITFVTIPRIQICSRLGLRFPSTSGIAGYAEKAVGPWGRYSVSYLVSGSYLFGLPAIAFIGSEYMRQFFNLSELGGTFCAILLVSLMFISNLFGIRAITLINYLALTVLFLLIGLIIVFNLDFVGFGLRIAGEALSGHGNVNPNTVWNVTALLFWAFLGWENLSFSLGEMKDPEKNVPRLYWLSFILVAAIYVLIALISVGASATGVSLKGAAGLSSLVLFIPGGYFLMWLIIIVLAANACSWNFTASRLIYAAGRTGVFPAVFGKLSKRNIPVNSLVTLYALSVSLITVLSFQDSYYRYDAARKPELYFPLRLHHNCLLENRNRLAEMDFFSSFTYIFELSGIRIYLEGHISGLFDRAWLFQVYRKKGRYIISAGSRFTAQAGTFP